jgi:hypothetical protein
MADPTYPNAGKAWTAADEQQVLDMMKEGKGLFWIAEAIGRTPGAVVARVEHHLVLIAQFERARKLMFGGSVGE